MRNISFDDVGILLQSKVTICFYPPPVKTGGYLPITLTELETLNSMIVTQITRFCVQRGLRAEVLY